MSKEIPILPEILFDIFRKTPCAGHGCEIFRKVVKDIDKKELLQKYYDQACHNLTCYSEDILMTEPKEGYEAEWKQANEELIQLEALIKEFTGTRKLFRAWDVEEKCWIPPEMVAITGEGKILTKDDEDEEWLEEIIQVVIVY